MGKTILVSFMEQQRQQQLTYQLVRHNTHNDYNQIFCSLVHLFIFNSLEFWQSKKKNSFYSFIEWFHSFHFILYSLILSFVVVARMSDDLICRVFSIVGYLRITPLPVLYNKQINPTDVCSFFRMMIWMMAIWFFFTLIIYSHYSYTPLLVLNLFFSFIIEFISRKKSFKI